MKRIERIGLIGLIGFIGLIGECRAQAVLGADTIALGDQTTLALPLSDGTVPAFDFGKVEVVRQQFDTATGLLQSTVTCFEPGEHWLHVGDDSLLLVVTDVDVDTTTAEIRDIAPIERVPYTFWELFRWVLLAWAVAAVGIVVWWLVDRKKRHGSIFVHQEPVDTRNPYERASEDLEALREKRLWQAGKVKEYHTELTDIVRRFIVVVNGTPATEMTSEECVSALMCKCVSADATTLLRSMFTTADLVKFAKSEPLPHEHEASLKAAVEFVDRLWEQVKPQETGDKETGDKETGDKETGDKMKGGEES